MEPLIIYFVIATISLGVVVAVRPSIRATAVAWYVRIGATFLFAMIVLQGIYSFVGCTIAYLVWLFLSYQNAFKFNGREPWPVDQPCPQLWKDEQFYPTF